MLILKLLDLQPMHGWGIGQSMQNLSRDALRLQPGALYGSLHRLTREGWVRSYWDDTASGRRARYYELTRAGKRRLEVETTTWRRLSGGVDLILAVR